MLDALLGREDLLTEVGGLVRSSPWTTLTGPPGSGKTLLARHVAAGRASAGDEVVWVDGSVERTLDAVVVAVLRASGPVLPGATTLDALTEVLSGRPVLLVLDGVDDHDGSLTGLARLVEQLVARAPDLRVLATAATRGGRPGERVVRVGPLPVPASREPLSGPAVELLLRTVELGGGHPVDLAAHGSRVREVLTASGGLPGLLVQLGSHIALVGLGGVLPTGLGHAIRVSYELLGPLGQKTFRRLAAFDQPVPMAALPALVEVDDRTAAECAASLARRNLLETTADARLRMLEPMRDLARSLPGADEDRAAAVVGILAWADEVVPDDFISGAADAAWLPDTDLLLTVVEGAAAEPGTRELAYALANRMFGALYTALRPRDAAAVLETVLAAGDGPPELGAQVARRAAIAVSEVRGTYAGLPLLDRAEQHAQGSPVQLARNASIRAEMHLDAGSLAEAWTEAQRVVELASGDGPSTLQAQRTLMDVAVSRGDFAAAQERASGLLTATDPDHEWVSVSAQVLLGWMALEQGRVREASATAKAAVERAERAHEDRMALLAGLLHGTADPAAPRTVPDLETLPWSVRVQVQVHQARDLLAAGDAVAAVRAAGDAVALADAAQLGRDGVGARLVLADALMPGDPGEAGRTYAGALQRAAAAPLPLRVADALDGMCASAVALGHVIGPRSPLRALLAASTALRSTRAAAAIRPATSPLPAVPAEECPAGWVVGGQLAPVGVEAAVALALEPRGPEGGATGVPRAPSALDRLSRAERAVAELVAQGHTTRQIAAELFVSPRTVDSQLASSYRKLGIASRAKLAALVVEQG